MANRHDDEFAAVAAIKSTDGAPWRLTLSNVAASITNLPAGRYIVCLDGGPATVWVRTGGVAAVPATGAAATGNTVVLQNGWTYVHAATADLSAILVSGTGELALQPVPGPG